MVCVGPSASGLVVYASLIWQSVESSLVLLLTWFTTIILKMEYSRIVYMVVLWLHFSCQTSAGESRVTCQSLFPGGSCQSTSSVCIPASPCIDYKIGGSLRDNVINNVRDCDRDPTNGDYRRCGYNMYNGTTSTILDSMSAIVVPLDSERFSINISWTLDGVSEDPSYGGYELRLKEVGARSLKRCHCVDNALNFDMLFVRYNNYHIELMVEVLPYPYLSESAVMTRFDNPSSCEDIPASDIPCSTGLYQNLTVESRACNGTKQLNISWDIAAGTADSATYYLYLYNSADSSTAELIFTVSDTTMVTIDNLDATRDYSVELQSFGTCLEARPSLPDYRGCGTRLSASATREEVSLECDVYVTTAATQDSTTLATAKTSTVTESPQPTNSSASSVTNSTPSHTNSTVAPSRPSSLLLSLVLIPLMIIVVVAILILLVLILKYRGHVPKSVEQIPICTKPTYRVFVFYCSSTPAKELEDIQKHVICPLSEYFDVTTPNNYIRGDVSSWLEETVQMSKAILLISDETFCSEWSKKGLDRDPALNCLHHLISAAVSHNGIERFGIITTRDSPKKLIPFNAYLQLMPVFVMSKSKLEVTEIYQFVTRYKPFQFSSTGSTPTTEGPEHVAICSTE